jgi:NAD(P)-dependent dehydrogenase (short-subunit alcohol dehydrogenase family)
MFYLTRACIPMLENAASPEDPARIINVGSVVGIVPQSAPTHAYDASKAAVHQLTKKLAGDLAPKNITVNALAPGFVPSRMTDGLGTWGATHDVIAKSIPLQRMGTEEDMAGACLYFSSRAGAWCTGVILNVDGGAVGAIQIELGSKL